MSFENLLFLLKNYAKHDYKNVIISGFTEERISKILEELKDFKCIVITLIVRDEEVLKRRVLTESRDSGFRDYNESIRYNRKLKDVLKFPNEHKIDNTNQTPEETANQIKTLLK